jgi:ribosomal protein S18 acetylase RimI-like enzyme
MNVLGRISLAVGQQCPATRLPHQRDADDHYRKLRPTLRKTLGVMAPYKKAAKYPSLKTRQTIVADASKWTSQAKKALGAASPLPAPWRQGRTDLSKISKSAEPNRPQIRVDRFFPLSIDPWATFTEPKCPDPSIDKMPHIARTSEVQKLLEQDCLGLSAYGNAQLTCPLQFQLRQSAAELKQGELEACLGLVEHTSGNDYKASSIGWKPKKKQEEMKDKDMIYMLVRERDTKAQPEKKVKEGLQDVGKDRKFNQYDGNQLSTLERMVYDYASDDEDDEDMTANTFVERPGPTSPKTDGKILGFMSFMFTHDDPPYEDREVVYMYEIHLMDKLRGCGLGSKLMEFLEMAARQTGLSKTMLTVFASNGAARRLYEKLGYEKDACSPEDRIVRRRAIKADYIIMSKELD